MIPAGENEAVVLCSAGYGPPCATNSPKNSCASCVNCYVRFVLDFMHHFLPSWNKTANPTVGLKGGDSPALVHCSAAPRSASS